MIIHESTLATPRRHQIERNQRWRLKPTQYGRSLWYSGLGHIPLKDGTEATVIAASGWIYLRDGQGRVISCEADQVLGLWERV